MPYYRCPGCALRQYSAAAESRCGECGTFLGRDERIFDEVPLARPNAPQRFARPATDPPAERAARSGGSTLRLV
jgi:hypothetical protein